jgi:hypothetical protein
MKTITSRRSLWDADHILPVAEGGGQCDLDNIRTLCLLCHREATAQLRARLKNKAGEPRQGHAINEAGHCSDTLSAAAAATSGIVP